MTNHVYSILLHAARCCRDWFHEGRFCLHYNIKLGRAVQHAKLSRTVLAQYQSRI